ncbi:MAG: SPFH domain-containing protein [Patescibacteria group bacterium]
MKKMLIAVACAALLSSCGGMNTSVFENVPAGHIGKIITPNGWERSFHEAGQVDLRGTNANGQQNSLVLLEVSAVQVQEHFANNQGRDRNEDHRIVTHGNVEGTTGQVPVAVDVYLRMRVSPTPALRNRVFAEMTPRAIADHDRASLITVQMIYNRYVLQEVRSTIRRVLGAYADDIAINAHRAEIEATLTRELLLRMRHFNVPLELQSVSLSNAAPDPTISASRIANAGAAERVASIDRVGAALQRNPRYVDLEQIRSMERIAMAGVEKGKPPTFIIGIDGPGAHAYAARQ